MKQEGPERDHAPEIREEPFVEAIRDGHCGPEPDEVCRPENDLSGSTPEEKEERKAAQQRVVNAIFDRIAAKNRQGVRAMYEAVYGTNDKQL